LGVIGASFGQSVRFHAVNLTPTDPTLPPGPCRLQMALLDLKGQPLVDAKGNPAVVEGSLDTGKSLTLVFHTAGLLRRGQRLAVRGQVTLIDEVKIPPGPCAQLVPSLEITDDFTARTDGYISPGEIAGFNPQPDPPAVVRVQFDFGLIGIAFGQQARLHLAAVPPHVTANGDQDAAITCHETLSFRNAAGNIVRNGRGELVTLDVDIPPGGFATLTLDSRGLVNFGQRLLIRPEIVSPSREVPPDPCRLFTSDVEIIDDITTRTSHFVSPAEIHGFNPQPDPPGVQLRQ